METAEVIPNEPVLYNKAELPAFEPFKFIGIDLPRGLMTQSFNKPTTKHQESGTILPGQDVVWEDPHVIGVFDGVPPYASVPEERWVSAPNTARKTFADRFHNNKLEIPGETFDPHLLIEQMVKDLKEADTQVLALKGEDNNPLETTATVMRFVEVKMPDGKTRLVGLFAQAGGEGDLFIRTKKGIVSLTPAEGEGSVGLGRNINGKRSYGVIALEPGDRIVVASDGLSEYRKYDDADTLSEKWSLTDPEKPLDSWYKHHMDKKIQLGLKDSPDDDCSLVVADIPSNYESWPERYAALKFHD